MDPRVEALVALLERHRATLKQAYLAVPERLRDVQPPDGTWSVGQVVEHLMLTQRGITKLLVDLGDAAAPRSPAEAFDRAEFVRRLDMPVFLDRSRRITGRQPPGELEVAEAWSALEAGRRSFLDVLERVSGRRLEDHHHPHPATGGDLDGYQWVAFLALHEARHAAQIEEVGASLGPDESG